jgi:hypothetical protein
MGKTRRQKRQRERERERVRGRERKRERKRRERGQQATTWQGAVDPKIGTAAAALQACQPSI